MLYENIVLVFPQKGNNFSPKDILYAHTTQHIRVWMNSNKPKLM
jgi:hypothetical protein